MSNFKKFLSVALFSVGATIVVTILLLYTAHVGDDANKNRYFLEGKVIDVAISQRILTLKDDQGREVGIAVLIGTDILDERGQTTVLSSIHRGSTVKVRGAISKENTFLPSEIRVIKQ
jgi:hypothetical protein